MWVSVILFSLVKYPDLTFITFVMIICSLIIVSRIIKGVHMWYIVGVYKTEYVEQNLGSDLIKTEIY